MKNIVEQYKNFLDHSENFDLILQQFKKSILNLENPIIEVGTNMGGSALCFMQVLKDEHKNNWLYTIDPYGGIPYHDGCTIRQDLYTDKLYRKTMKDLYHFSHENDINYCHFKCTSKEFCDIIYNNVCQYSFGKIQKFDKFSFIFLDGSHNMDVVLEEIGFFVNKIESSGCLMIDDIDSILRVNTIISYLKACNNILNFDIYPDLIKQRFYMIKR